MTGAMARRTKSTPSLVHRATTYRPSISACKKHRPPQFCSEIRSFQLNEILITRGTLSLISTFDAPGAGTASGQGRFAEGITAIGNLRLPTAT
jgi:hypothetical protein